MATVQLNWGAPASGGPVESYKVYRKAGSDTAANIIASGTLLVTTADANTTTYSDTSLSSGAGQYSWTVTAYNSAGESLGATPTSQTL